MAPDAATDTRQIRYCTGCGEPRPDVGRFCGSCGTAFGDEVQLRRPEAGSAGNQPRTAPEARLPGSIARPDTPPTDDQVALATFMQRWAAAFLDQWLFIFTLGIGWAAWCWYSSRGGQSPGKQLVGLRVVDLDSGQVVIRSRAFVRAVLRNGFDLVSLVLLFIPSAVAAWVFFNDPLQRAPWDRAMRTLVVHDRDGRTVPVGASFTTASKEPGTGPGRSRPVWVPWAVAAVVGLAVGALGVVVISAASDGDEPARFVSSGQVHSTVGAYRPETTTTTTAPAVPTVGGCPIKPGTSCSGAFLFGVNLGGADLAGADLSAANLSNTNLIGADLSGADLAGADLRGTKLTRADLTKANLAATQLYGANLAETLIEGADFTGADLSFVDLSTTRGRPRLAGAKLCGTVFAGDEPGAGTMRCLG